MPIPPAKRKTPPTHRLPLEIFPNLMKIIYYFGHLISGIFVIFVIRYTDAHVNKVGPQIVCNFQSMQSHVELNSLFFKFLCYITRPDQMRHWKPHKLHSRPHKGKFRYTHSYLQKQS